MAEENLAPASLIWGLNHILEFGDTDLFPPLFEFELIKKNWKHFESILSSEALSTYSWQSPRQWLIPKDQISFRTATQLDPVDSIVFTALTREISQLIERKRIPVSTESVFSYRVAEAPERRLYQAHTRQAFWRESKSLARQFPFVAVLDITDFYNQIEHSSVIGALETASVSPVRRTAIQQLLTKTSNGSNRGIPIGPQASHLLAEAALIPLDNFLHSQYRFTRYADDMHVFCRTYAECQTAIFQIANFLNQYQKLSLNRQKTDVKAGVEVSDSASRMLIDDPINDAEEKMLEVIRRNLIESGEVEPEDYGEIRLSDLDQADAAVFSASMLESVLDAYLTANPAAYLRLRWFLRRITQVGAPGAVKYVVSRMDRFAPAIVDAVRYLSSSANEYDGSWQVLGGKLIGFLKDPLIRANDYLQVSIIGLFWRVTDLNHIKRLLQMFQGSAPAIRREIVLAASAQVGSDWIRPHLAELQQADAWLRRAMLYSMRSLPETLRRSYSSTTVKTAEDLMTNCLLDTLDQPTESAKAIAASSGPSIGIITALPEELAAMLALVEDPKRTQIDRPGAMKQCYLCTLPARDGGVHRVALAYSGQGNNQAAVRATNLTRDFSSIKQILMVGIAGGVPNPKSPDSHVRLGDIVVSGEHGIVQYDLVKDSSGMIEHRNPPRPPSASMLEAVRLLETEMRSGYDPLSVHISNALEKLRQRRPASKFDVLVDSDNPESRLRHPKDKARRNRAPRIFIGPIASANKLLKNPKTRDEIRDKFKVKAVEMEGSGIADSAWNLEIGYIAIRGICDYCDSRKDDRWHEYAAIVAAAYARTLLESICPIC